MVATGGDGSAGKEVTSVCQCVYVVEVVRGDYGMTGWPGGWVGKITR